MSEPIIRVENISKKYIIGHQKQERYTALRDVITNNVKSFSGKLLKPFGKKIINPEIEEFWALKDVNFEINRGDRVGIIGRNGAGKSTLLKILSRITEPSAGRISIKGRVASLLEVGTGFHPELTGRENIYLNGAILGMSREEIKKKFDEIVAFAEVEKFLDTPVKRYSSGMYVRLAFAVAAHLEPEILIVDEVLAVGDAQFQKKCLGKMENVAEKEGRTVLFVSHQMGAIAQLCSRVFILEKGRLVKSGTTQNTISSYMENLSVNESNRMNRSNLKSKIAESEDIYIVYVETINASEIPTSNFGHNEAITLKIGCKVKTWYNNLVISIALKDRLGRKIFTSEMRLDDIKKNEESFSAKVKLPIKFLTPGKYYFTIALHLPNVRIVDYIDEACLFNITDIGSEFAIYEGLDYGCVFANCEWNIASCL